VAVAREDAPVDLVLLQLTGIELAQVAAQRYKKSKAEKDEREQTEPPGNRLLYRGGVDAQGWQADPRLEREARCRCTSVARALAQHDWLRNHLALFGVQLET